MTTRRRRAGSESNSPFDISGDNPSEEQQQFSGSGAPTQPKASPSINPFVAPVTVPSQASIFAQSQVSTHNRDHRAAQ